MLVLFINLDMDGDRRRRVKEELGRQGIAASRIVGVHGGSIPRTARAFIPGAAETPPGTLGCFLSHIRAWELIVGSGREGAVVLEDDIAILRSLSEDHDQSRASGHDLIFFNDRMALAGVGDQTTALASLAEVFLSRTGPEQIPCGTDGYYISRAGALRLLDIVRHKGVWGNVDWFIVAGALGRSGYTELTPVQPLLIRLDEMLTRYDFVDPQISVMALRNPAVRHLEMTSTRLEMNRAARRQTSLRVPEAGAG